ncbi:Acetyltransferase (isoleucine patch superfamily) [Clostridium cavendishii DSM 21758]|uniref:Acetyltransferase (Isoleucine patch superfamily) n=1 Tax=Clostridium cavendishii DSM 21758 TaxID=1121302 RepID=A0A1M6QDS8_9CLOT|nr:acyltransferase [Clostridium cavendishii]SHK18409.1 Acetyltransferase (isoleucine patch superfamily) [Clostridium cavendishii DSM 21758]
MTFLKYWIAKFIYILTGRNMNYMIRFFRKSGMFIGQNCNIYSNIITSESYLITINDNVTISNDVQLITHDNSICKVCSKYTDIFGEIIIGKNCFIGARVTILPGISLADDIIVGSGSVVTKSFNEKGIIIGGNPAKKIGTIEEYLDKNKGYGVNIEGMSYSEKKYMIDSNKSKLIKK